MKILSLNCRGLGIAEAVQELRYLANEEGLKSFFYLIKQKFKVIFFILGKN